MIEDRQAEEQEGEAGRSDDQFLEKIEIFLPGDNGPDVEKQDRNHAKDVYF